MGMMKEFKQFAAQGNMVDMAVGIVIGVAFGKIVSSLVGDVIMPFVGLALGGVNFMSLRLILKEAVGTIPAITLNYGSFIQTIVDFVSVSFAIFLMVKGVNAMKRKQAETPAAPSNQEVLLSEIRDLLKGRSAAASAG